MLDNFKTFAKYLGLFTGIFFAFLFILVLMTSVAGHFVSIALALEHLYNMRFKPVTSADYALSILVFWTLSKILLGAGRKIFSKE